MAIVLYIILIWSILTLLYMAFGYKSPNTPPENEATNKFRITSYDIAYATMFGATLSIYSVMFLLVMFDSYGHRIVWVAAAALGVINIFCIQNTAKSNKG